MADEPKNPKDLKDSKITEEAKASEKPDLPAGRQGIPDIPNKPDKPDIPETPKLKLSKKLTDIIEQVEKLTVLELADLVKALENKFGISGVPVAAAPASGKTIPAGEATGETPGEGTSEQTTFNVVLASPGANKISAIKMVREINQTLGLKEAKDLVESTPKEILSGVNKSTAEEAKKKLEGVGASVELK